MAEQVYELEIRPTPKSVMARDSFTKHFHSDFDNPPFMIKVYTYFVFWYLVFSQSVVIALRKIFVKPQDRLKKDSLKLVTFSEEVYPHIDDSIELAGNRHEIDPNYFHITDELTHIYNVGAVSRNKACFHREIMSCPSHLVRVSDGVKINFCSYNYLGFAEDDFNEELLKAVEKYGYGGQSRSKQRSDLVEEVEKEIAEFVGKEDAIVHGMGFDTNALIIPWICKKNSVLISDSLNHSSIVEGCRRAHCTIKPFKHTIESLEDTLKSIDMSKYQEAWVIVEGLYSMEGCYVKLPEIMQLKEKYGFKLYIDEAHSIGGTGVHGHGVCEKFNVDPKDVEVLMGTFTKSFSAVGGYVASDRETIERIKQNCACYTISQPMQPICAEEILCCLAYMKTSEGLEKIKRLHSNSMRVRNSLKAMGFTVYGDTDSPVIPLLYYSPTKMKFIQDYLLKRNIAIVQVGFPAVPVVSGRTRFCISAAHTDDEINYMLECMDELGDLIHLKYEKKQ